MNVIQVPVDQLRHAEYNPRKITPADFDQIKKSIEEFGFVQPLVVNKASGREGVIIGGNQRYEVAKKIGMGEVPVFYVQIEDLNREKELNIRLNKNQADWDFEMLLKDFNKENLLEWGFEPFEFLSSSEKINPNTEWEGMPEFEVENKESIRRIIIHFKTNQHVEEFAKLLRQRITDKTKFLWYPEERRMDTESKRY